MDRTRQPAGEHTLTLSNPNFVGITTDTVSIPHDGPFTKKYSFYDSGELQVTARLWAEVFIDGLFIGQTPLNKVDLPVGRHQVTLRHPDLGEKRFAVDTRESFQPWLAATTRVTSDEGGLLPLSYSYRSTSTGSTRVARRAGK